jgi:hypothetical protein
MIKQIIELLNIDDWYGISEEVDIAKGKYKAIGKVSDMKKQLKRYYYGSK